MAKSIRKPLAFFTAFLLLMSLMLIVSADNRVTGVSFASSSVEVEPGKNVKLIAHFLPSGTVPDEMLLISSDESIATGTVKLSTVDDETVAEITINGIAKGEAEFTFRAGSALIYDNGKDNDILDIWGDDDMYSGYGEGKFKVTVKSTRIPGDANGDGVVTNRDASRILQYLAHWPVEIDLDAANCNGDSSVTNRDASRILQFLAHWPVTLN